MSQAQQDRRIDYIEFTVPDIRPERSFYQRVFRWDFTDYGLEYTSFTDGRLNGGFRAGSSQDSPLVVIYSVDLEAAEAAVSAAGGHITTPVFSFPAGRWFHFTDPAGQELAVWSDGETHYPRA